MIKKSLIVNRRKYKKRIKEIIMVMSLYRTLKTGTMKKRRESRSVVKVNLRMSYARTLTKVLEFRHQVV